jgi:hypothetical protein
MDEILAGTDGAARRSLSIVGGSIVLPRVGFWKTLEYWGHTRTSGSRRCNVPLKSPVRRAVARGTFKEEVVWPNEFESLEQATRAVDEFFLFCNQDYPHSALMDMRQIDFEATLNQTQTTAA